MKFLITFVIILTIIQNVIAQSESTNNSFEAWQKESLTSKRMLPRYGHLPKSEWEIESDSSFIKSIMASSDFKTRRQASDHLIQLGFNYLYRNDPKTAMSRFNQSYLLDSTTTDDYWGYGGVYMQLKQFDLAIQQYQNGLKLDSVNTHLWTDYGTVFMGKYYMEQSLNAIDTAISLLQKSYSINSKDVNTTYKLSVCYWIQNKCAEAWTYYDETMLLGGAPVTEKFTKDLKARCSR